MKCLVICLTVQKRQKQGENILVKTTLSFFLLPFFLSFKSDVNDLLASVYETEANSHWCLVTVIVEEDFFLNIATCHGRSLLY